MKRTIWIFVTTLAVALLLVVARPAIARQVTSDVIGTVVTWRGGGDNRSPAE